VRTAPNRSRVEPRRSRPFGSLARLAIGTSLSVLVVLLFDFSSTLPSHSPTVALSESGDGSGNLAIADFDSLPMARHLYPYSVIPGGVESGGELQNAIRNDPVVARHYADFDMARTRIISSDRERMVYVSYRMDGRIFWTNRALRLPKGEALITDGIHEARTRCGNQISETAQGPVSEQQPALTVFEQFGQPSPAYGSGMEMNGEEALSPPYSPAQPLMEHSESAERAFPSSSGPELDFGTIHPAVPESSAVTGYSPGSGTFLNRALPPGGIPGSGPSSESGVTSGGTVINEPEPSSLLMLSAGLCVWLIVGRLYGRGANVSER